MAEQFLYNLKVIWYSLYGQIHNVYAVGYNTLATARGLESPFNIYEIIYFYPDPETRYQIDGWDISEEYHYVEVRHPVETGIEKLRLKTQTEMILNKADYMARDDEEIIINIPGITDADGLNAEIFHYEHPAVFFQQLGTYDAQGRLGEVLSPEERQAGRGRDLLFRVVPIVLGQPIRAILDVPGPWFISLSTIRYHAYDIQLEVKYNYHDELIRQANLLSLAGNFNSHDLLKRNLAREIARLQREEEYIEATDTEKRARHYAECEPVSDEGSMATYLTTLSRLCECVIANLPYDEARSIFPITAVDKKIVVPVSIALSVMWLRSFRLTDVYRGALPGRVSTKIDYSHIFEAPDMSRSVCAPRTSFIDEIVDRWCDNIEIHSAELLRSTMTTGEFTWKLQELFYEILMLDDEVVCINDIPFEVDDQYVCGQFD